jgi:hypothetical protein
MYRVLQKPQQHSKGHQVEAKKDRLKIFLEKLEIMILEEVKAIRQHLSGQKILGMFT